MARSNGDVVVNGNEKMLFSVVSLLDRREIVPTRFHVEQTTLDDAFVAITGRRLESADEGAAGT